MPNPYKNKVVYNGTTLIDLTSDTVTPETLMQGYTAHDASGALINGGMELTDLTVTPLEESQYITPEVLKGDLIERREISGEYVGGNLSTEVNNQLGNVSFSATSLYFVGELTVVGKYVISETVYYEATTEITIDGSSTPGDRGWGVADVEFSYSGSTSANLRIAGLLVRGTNNGVTQVKISGHNTSTNYYRYEISGWIETYKGEGAAGFQSVYVEPIPEELTSAYQDGDGFVVIRSSESTAPQDSISITANGTYDVTDYAGANVSVGDPQEICVYVGIDGQYGYDFTIKISQTVVGSATIDWGDGTPEENADSAVGTTVPLTHTYSEAGLYKVRLYSKNGGSFGLSENSMGAYTSKDYKVVGVEINAIGSSTTLATGALRSLMNCSFVKIGDGIKVLGSRAISENNSQILYIPATVTSITGNYQFGPNPSLKFIRIDTPLTQIPEAMCYQCESLETIVLTNCVPTRIGPYAFRNCSSLKTFTIPASVKVIDNYAFAQCTSLADVHVLAATPPKIYNNTFGWLSSTCTIYVPSESLSAYQTAEYWSNHASQIVGE